jgi:hypothetical protein
VETISISFNNGYNYTAVGGAIHEPSICYGAYELNKTYRWEIEYDAERDMVTAKRDDDDAIVVDCSDKTLSSGDKLLLFCQKIYIYREFYIYYTH